MTQDQDAFSRVPPHWTQGGAAPQASLPQRSASSPLNRFLGGSPAAVFMKLIFVSLIVGALMMWLDLRPVDLVNSLMRLINRIWLLGFDAVREVADYILAGAMIVLPIWLITRLLNMRHAR
jgi:hypothetical protein